MTNLARTYLIAVLIIGPVLGANSQELPQAILVDEYSTTACDDFLGRLDGFLSELRLHSESKGFILIRNLPAGRPGSAMLQSMIEYQLDFRGFDRTRIEIVRADGTGPYKEFWRLPPGASKPKVEQVVAGFEISETVREPFILAEETKFGTQICPAIDDMRIFAEFMKANPSARGNIVVRDSSDVKARKRAASILRKLEVKYRISRNRLRSFNATLQRPASHDEAVVEYWYLP